MKKLQLCKTNLADHPWITTIGCVVLLGIVYLGVSDYNMGKQLVSPYECGVAHLGYTLYGREAMNDRLQQSNYYENIYSTNNIHGFSIEKGIILFGAKSKMNTCME